MRLVNRPRLITIRPYENINDKMQNFNQIKQSALAHFQELGFPTTRQEDWRFTNLKELQQMTFENPPGLNGNILPDNRIHPLSFTETTTQVFVNGFPQSELNSNGFPVDMIIKDLSVLSEQNLELNEIGLNNIFNYSQHPFVAQNTSEMKNGIYIHIPNEMVIEKPLHLLWVITGNQPIQVFPRVLIQCDDSARVTIIEHFVTLSTVQTFTNAVTEIQMGENAKVEYLRIQNEGQSVYHISALGVCQDAHSQFNGHTLTFGGKLTRNDVDIQLTGEGAECRLNGLYAMRNKQHVDNHTVIRHIAPHTTSNENYKGIVTDQAQGVFDGKIVVSKNAAKTDAVQTNRNILLSDSAGVNSNPCLEIYTDDVACKHGSTTGQLDDDAIFYLQSRGIDPRSAKGLLINGFSAEIIDGIKQKSVKLYLNNLLANWLTQNKLGD